MKNGLCTLCAGGMRGFDRAYSYGYYEGPLRKLIHLFKYSGMKPLGKRLAGFLCRALPDEDVEGIDAVVPMPLHWRRRWRRGFNQSEILARLVAGSCRNGPSRPDAEPRQARSRDGHPGRPDQQQSQEERRRGVSRFQKNASRRTSGYC